MRLSLLRIWVPGQEIWTVKVPSKPMILYFLGDVAEISNNGSTDVAWSGGC